MRLLPWKIRDFLVTFDLMYLVYFVLLSRAALVELVVVDLL